MGDSGMRPSSLTYILLGVLIFAATYRLLNQPPFPDLPPDQFDLSGQYPFKQKPDPLPIYKDEARLPDGDLVPANVDPDELAIAKDKAQLEDRSLPPTNQSSNLKDAKQNLHVSHPDRLAWKSMCATDEGRGKGEKWCKRAIWGNTLPAIKHIWKTVNNLTSAAFVGMWQQRVSQFYSRHSEATPN